MNVYSYNNRYEYMFQVELDRSIWQGFVVVKNETYKECSSIIYWEKQHIIDKFLIHPDNLETLTINKLIGIIKQKTFLKDLPDEEFKWLGECLVAKNLNVLEII